jgi:hypothetical protein
MPRYDDDDEDDDDRPRRPRKRQKSAGVNPVLIVGVGVCAVFVLVCGGGALAYLAFSSRSPFGNSYVITGASRTRSPTGGTSGVSVSWKTTKTDHAVKTYAFVFKAGGKTFMNVMEIGPTAGGTGSMSVPTRDLEGEPGPVEVWVEKRPPGGEGTVVSNVFVIP